MGACAGATTLVVRGARAHADKLAVAARGAEVGAIVAAIGGDHVAVVIDPKLRAHEIRIAAADPVDVCARMLLKGAGEARGRFLDDARNAPKLGVNVRKALSSADPSHEEQFRHNHVAWSRPFARKVLAWQTRLARSALRGKAVRDEHGRVYLLEWAGATVTPGARSTGPGALASLPPGPAAPTLDAYQGYVEKLVAAVSAG